MLKSAIHRVISILPWPSVWNQFFQRFVTRSLDLGAGGFQGQLERCQIHLGHYMALQNERRENFSVLEIGTGWYPTLPMGLYLSGSGSIWTFDIVSLLRQSRIERMVKHFCEFDDLKKLRQYLPLLREDRMNFLRESAPFAGKESPKEFLARFKIFPRVQRGSHWDLPDGSVDLSFSHAVLQHIPRAGLKEVLSALRRLSSSSSVTSHWINLSDLFSNSDTSISPFNCLQFSDRQWRWLDSPLASQHRLRISDYRELFAEAGFKIQSEASTAGLAQDLETIRLAPEFKGYSREDLLVLSSWLVAVPA